MVSFRFQHFVVDRRARGCDHYSCCYCFYRVTGAWCIVVSLFYVCCGACFQIISEFVVLMQQIYLRSSVSWCECATFAWFSELRFLLVVFVLFVSRLLVSSFQLNVVFQFNSVVGLFCSFCFRFVLRLCLCMSFFSRCEPCMSTLLA